MTRVVSTRKRTPPTTPPMMAPLLSVEVDAGVSVGEGGAVASPSMSVGGGALAASSRARVAL